MAGLGDFWPPQATYDQAPQGNGLLAPLQGFVPHGDTNQAHDGMLTGLRRLVPGFEPAQSAKSLQTFGSYVAPGLTDYLSHATPPPSYTPNAAGKIPGVGANPYEAGAVWDLFNLGTSFLPMGGGAKVAMAAAPIAASAMAAKAAKTLARTERFDWPVRTLSGSVIDMPIVVNPSRSHMQRLLAEAPHGDVRALKTPAGDVYAWPANEAMHVDIASTFDLPFKTRQELQSASYLMNKKDVDALGKYSNFDELVAKLGQ